MKQRVIFCIAILTFISCVKGVRSFRQGGEGEAIQERPPTKRTLPGNETDAGSLPGDGGLGNTTDNMIKHGKVELRHIVDPFDGTYKTKVSLPKNFSGPLYLSGLNVTSLSRYLLTVRFKFGQELGIVDIPARVGRAPGITPQTDIEVLILDTEGRPFENLRLFYDLYDYNNYDSNNNGVEFEESDKPNEPVADEQDGGLYCRGLRLEHDPTFQGSSRNDRCDEPGERCLYAYAKLKDSGLVDENGIAKNPKEPHIALDLQQTERESIETALQMGLPDINDRSFLINILRLNLNSRVKVGIVGGGTLAFGDTVEFKDPSVSPESLHRYTYKGPYRPLSLERWQIEHMALLSDIRVPGTTPSGLFQGFAPNGTGEERYDCATGTKSSGCAHRGTKSFLFPRAGKIELRGDIPHYASEDPLYLSGGRRLKRLSIDGISDYMEGVNFRVVNYDDFTTEGIGSCNVTATIEILAKESGSKQTSTLVSDHKLKLQIVRGSQLNHRGKEVLFTSMKTCTNNRACGGNECCYNNRCWSRELVSQCLDSSEIVGNRGVGEFCNSDFDCSGLCCNTFTGTCDVHINKDDQKVLCSKPPGQTCVASEWCRVENISRCFIVKTGLNPKGEQLCALRCYNVPTQSTCRNGLCYPPDIPTIPFFDPKNPQCEEAIDPPTQFN